VEYKHFVLSAFQHKPGQWRASVKRSDGMPLAVVGPHRLEISESTTHLDSLTANEALRMAIVAIDAGAFSHQASPASTSEGALAS
jgi:hypothetical protein